MQTQLVVFLLHTSSPSLDSNCACWTLEQPYQIMPKLSLGSAVDIAPDEKGLKNLSCRNSKYTELSIIEQGRCYKRDVITKSSYLRLNRTNSSKAPWFSQAPWSSSSSFAAFFLVHLSPKQLCSSLASKAFSRKNLRCWQTFSAEWEGSWRHNDPRSKSAQSP